MKMSKTVASPSTRRSVVAARSGDFRLPFCSRLSGAMKTAACPQRATTAAAAGAEPAYKRWVQMTPTTFSCRIDRIGTSAA